MGKMNGKNSMKIKSGLGNGSKGNTKGLQFLGVPLNGNGKKEKKLQFLGVEL